MLLLNEVENNSKEMASLNNEEKARKLIGKDNKLIYEKERYVIHHEMLKFYLKQGAIITKVHKIITR